MGDPAQAMPVLEQLSHLLFTCCGLHTNGRIALCTSSLPHPKVILFQKITGTQSLAYAVCNPCPTAASVPWAGRYRLGS